MNSMKEGHGFCAPKVTTFPGIQKKIITMNLNSPSHHLLFTMNSHWGLCPKTNYYKSDGNVVWSFNCILLQYSMDFEGSDHIRKVIISAVSKSQPTNAVLLSCTHLSTFFFCQTMFLWVGWQCYPLWPHWSPCKMAATSGMNIWGIATHPTGTKFVFTDSTFSFFQ